MKGKIMKKRAGKPKKPKMKAKQPKEDVSDEYPSENEADSDLEHLEENFEEPEIYKSQNSDDENEEMDEENSEAESEMDEDEVKKHKFALDKLKDTDPEFYKFLKENDEKLLNFNVSDDEESADEGQEDEEEDNRHIPSGELEKNSDESDFEDEDTVRDKKSVTLKMLKQWRSDLATDKSNKTITQVIRAFNAALQTVAGAQKDDDVQYYKVEGSAVFNGVITLCVLDLGPAMRRFLGLKSGSQMAHKTKKFAKLKSFLKSYFYDLLKLLGSVTSANILTVLLKHLHYMTSFLASFPPIVKPYLKKLIKLWSTADESVRVVAFLCILRITHKNLKLLLNDVLKWMNLAYVQNSKFVSNKTLPNINFMRRSLVEMYSLDLGVAYEQMFLYTRQMAILVRNAIMQHTTENIQTVYNWQFINNLRLWANLLAANSDKAPLQPLVYPFVQLCFGTVNLVPTTQFYPLRFHIVQILTDLAKETKVFVNPIPLLLEVLDNYDFNKAHAKASMKPVNFTFILRASKSQMSESGFKDTLVETVYASLLDYLSLHATKLAFPELTILVVVSLKKFVASCKRASFTSKIKQLIERVEQTSNYIEKYRKSLSANLRDTNEIERIERDLLDKKSPLLDFYLNWKKLQSVKKRKLATETEEISEHNLPTLNKNKKRRKQDDGPVTLFPSDDENSDNDMPIEKIDKMNKKRGKRGNKKIAASKSNNGEFNHEDVAGTDLVEDLNADDW